MAEDAWELVTRNAVEIVTEEELRRILEEKDEPVAYVGFEPSGDIHLGHKLVIDKMVDLQRAGFRVIILLADLHAYLNEKGSLEEVRELAEYNKRCFTALGLDPKRTEFVLGSEFQLEEDYALDVYRMARHTTMRRARRSMDMIARREENPPVSQAVYPLMQALDIVHLNVDLAVGGLEQRKIHMLARDVLPKLGYDAPTCLHTPIIHGLDGEEKMSSSKGNYIAVNDDPETIREKLRRAYCPAGEAEGNPVLEIYRYFIFREYDEVTIERPEKYGGDVTYTSYEELERDFVNEDLHPLDLKENAARYLAEILEPVRKAVGTPS
ncbi:tyrosine--tRNA ligase [Methanopyrus sp.]|jgi:tyrosyl-tRNA synthetase